MFRNKFISFFLLILTIFSLNSFALAQDEEDTSILQLTNLFDGDTVEGELSEDVPTMLYVFNGNEGDEVTIEMVEVDDSGIDPLIIVLGSAGEFIATNDDQDEDDLTARLEDLELPATGTYFLIASTVGNMQTNEFDNDDMAYELSIEGNSEVEDLGEGFTYFADELTDGDEMSGETSDDLAAYYFFFNGEEGDVISVSATTDEFDPLVYVFGPGGVRIAANDDIDAEAEDLNSLVEEVELPEDGVYLVVVSNVYALYYGVDDEDASFGEFDVELTLD